MVRRDALAQHGEREQHRDDRVERAEHGGQAGGLGRGGANRPLAPVSRMPTAMMSGSARRSTLTCGRSDEQDREGTADESLPPSMAHSGS
jgi:hypothetical protein